MAASKWLRRICPDRHRHQIIHRRGRVERFPPGLAFHCKWALISLSKPRHDSGFEDLQIGHRLQETGQDPDCAIVCLNIETGVIDYQVGIGPEVDEIYDVAVLPGIHNPLLVDPRSDVVKSFIRPKVP